LLQLPGNSIVADFFRIDVHHHLSPPAYLDALGDEIGPPLKNWSLAKSIEDMDEGEVATAILSVTQITMRVDDREKVRRLARECNDYSAKIVADHRGRFGMFTALPVPDIDGCLKEIEYGFDVLKADGVGLYTSYRDKWLGDPAFDPIFAELDRRKAVIYVHPATPDCCVNLVPGIQDANIEYGTDTTRAIARMIFGGAAQRFPNIRIIWSHAGGTMPFLIYRFLKTANIPANAKFFPQGLIAELKKFYYDTAQAMHPAMLTMLRSIIGLEHTVFGSDYPWGESGKCWDELKATGVLSEAELSAIEYRTIAPLLPRFKL
jgi:6-methylsalicylate decarboxylase